MSEIPFVIIAWNNLTFVKAFVEQIMDLSKRIIILDNHSEYQPLLDYYDYLEEVHAHKFDIRRLDQNYGHTVCTILKDTLPDIYALSDPDLRLNPSMPRDVIDQLYYISKKYNCSKVGLALDISDHSEFIPGYGDLVYRIESSYYRNQISDSEYTLYNAGVDTTFCLINNTVAAHPNIRVAGNFTAKHLPWYNNYLKNNIPREELKVWVKNNKSSSILHYIDVNALVSWPYLALPASPDL
jgi:hypothetical protein